MSIDHQQKDRESFIKRFSAWDGIGLLFYIAAVMFVALMDPYKDNTGHLIFYCVLFASTVAFFILKKRFPHAFSSAAISIVILAEVILLVFVGGSHRFAKDAILNHLTPDKSATFIERSSDGNGYTDYSFRMYYFRNKEVICNADVSEKISFNGGAYESYYNFTVTKDNSVRWNEQLPVILVSNERYIDLEDNIYVIDNSIDTGRIVAVENQDGNLCYFSEELYNISLEDSKYQSDAIESSNESARNKLAEIVIYKNKDKEINYNMVANFITIFLLLLIGVIVCISFCINRSGWMIGMLSIPFGVVVWTFSGLFLVVCKLPYNLLTQGMIIAFVLVALIVWKRKVFCKYCYKKLILPIGVLLFCAFYYAATCHTVTWGDSLMKITHGLVLAVDNHPELRFTRMVMYGIIEPYIHSLGYMLGGDYVYILYPVFFIIAIGIIAGGAYEVYRRGNNNRLTCSQFIQRYKNWGLLVILALGVLITNTDFAYAKYYVMSHILISVYFLIFVESVLYSKVSGIFSGESILGVLISAIAIIITRTEGIIYCLFFLTIFAGHMKNREYFRTGHIVCLLCIVWTVIQLCLFNGDTGGGYFFSPVKGCVLIAGSLATVLFLYLVSKRRLQLLTAKHYILKYLFGLFIAMIVGSCIINQEMAKSNFDMLISHLSSFMEPTMNSGYLWGLIFISISLLIAINDDVSNISIGIILGYLGVIFLVFLFRTDLPMRAGFGDSCRRLLVHMMPSAVYLVLISTFLAPRDMLQDMSL